MIAPWITTREQNKKSVKIFLGSHGHLHHASCSLRVLFRAFVSLLVLHADADTANTARVWTVESETREPRESS